MTWCFHIVCRFVILMRNAGLEHIRFHDLRHTFATLALQNGIDVKTVSSMLIASKANLSLHITLG